MKTLIKVVIEKINKYKQYRQTYKELHSLSDYELSDIGITRYDITRIAQEVYYR